MFDGIFFAPHLRGMTPPSTLKLASKARGLIEEGRDIINLALGQSDFKMAPHIIEAIIKEATSGFAPYTDIGGNSDIKHAVIDKFKETNGLNYKPDEILVSSGAIQILSNAFRASISPGDETVITTPCWDAYPYLVEMAGGAIRFIHTNSKSGFKMRPEELEEAITPRTKWLLLNNPNNPSGAVYTETELVAIADALKRHPHVAIMSDEVYEHCIHNGTKFVSMAAVDNGSLYERTLTINSCSKAHNMPGLRIGYAGAAKALLQRMALVQAITTMNPASLSQAATIAALRGPQNHIPDQTEVFSRRLDTAVSILNTAPGLACTKPDGAFYLLVDCSGLILNSKGALKTDYDVALKFLEAGVAVAPGESSGAPGFVRIACTTERMPEASNRIRQACINICS